MSPAWVVASVLIFVGTSACVTDLDCSLNGVCSAAAVCEYDAGWRGSDCGVLDLVPAERGSGYNLTAIGTSSWGGRIIRDPRDKNLHHLFAAEFTGGCGLDYWSPMSRIIRAESRMGYLGPYKFTAEVVPTFAHNPTVILGPNNTYLMYHIGCKFPQPGSCEAPQFACDGGDAINGESGITLRTSSDLITWTEVGRVLTNNTPGVWDTDTTNPSAWTQSDGSIVLFYRGCPYNCGGAELLNYAVGPAAAGPFTRASTSPIFDAPAEDPMVWQDRRGRWHVLMHSLEPDGGFGNGPNVGRHGYTEHLGNKWTFNNATLAFNTTVHFTDGTTTTYFRRERPQLFFSNDGSLTPIALVTGVQEVHSPQSYTLIQPVGPGGR